MPYANLYCSNEKTYRWHAVNDIKQTNNPILQAIIKQVKEDIADVLEQIEGVTSEMITVAMEKYRAYILGIQMIHCPSCKSLQVDVIVDDQTKSREDRWRSYETGRYVRQFIGGI